jgi:hypothetical protein
MAMPTPHRRRWYQVRLRTLFAIVTVAGLAVGFPAMWIHYRHLALRRIVANGGSVEPGRAPFILRPFGEAGFESVTIHFINGEEPTPFKGLCYGWLFPEATLYRLSERNNRVHFLDPRE